MFPSRLIRFPDDTHYMSVSFLDDSVLLHLIVIVAKMVSSVNTFFTVYYSASRLPLSPLSLETADPIL
jgi:hypothetical protein